MNDKRVKYKLGITEIIAFVAAIFILVLSRNITLTYVESEAAEIVVFVTILGFFAAMYGMAVGALAGFLGVVCGFVLNGAPVVYSDVLAMTALGALIGQSASGYKIRNGGFHKREIALFLMTEGLACVIAIIFIKPFIDYIFYNKDLFEALSTGMKITVICAIPSNFGLAILFFIINAIYISRAKS